MGISILPNVGEMIGQSLAQLGQSLGQIINPHAQLRRMVQQAVIQNPEFASTLGKAVRDNPSLYQDVLGEDLMGTLSAMPLTFEQETTKRAQEFISRMGTGGETVRVLGKTIPIPKAEEADIPGLLAASREFRVQPSELATLGQEIRLRRRKLEAEGEVLEPETAARISQAEETVSMGALRQELIGNTLEFVRSADNKTRRSAQELIPGFFSEEFLKLRFRNEMDLVLARDKNDYDRYMRNTLTDLAESWARKAGGDLDTWKAFFSDPATMTRARELLNNPDLAKSELDKNLLNAARAVGQATTNDAITENVRVMTSIRLAEGQLNDNIRRWRLREIKDEELESSVSSLSNVINSNLQVLSSFRQFTGNPLPQGLHVEVKRVKKLGRDPYEWIYKDASGNTYSSEDVSKLFSTATTTQSISTQEGIPSLDNIDVSRLTPRAREAYRILRSGGGTLEELRRDAPNTYQELIGASR